jgi:hypothetical protein
MRAAITRRDGPPRRQTRFTARDLKRAIKAALAAGLAIGCVRIESDGAIVILPGDVSSSPGPNDWD